MMTDSMLELKLNYEDLKFLINLVGIINMIVNPHEFLLFLPNYCFLRMLNSLVTICVPSSTRQGALVFGS